MLSARLECLLRQAQYVWFTREVEPLSRRVQEPTLKDDSDPLALSPPAPTTGPARRGRPPRRPNAYPSAPVLRVVGGADGGAEGAEGAEGARPGFSLRLVGLGLVIARPVQLEQLEGQLEGREAELEAGGLEESEAAVLRMQRHARGRSA